LKKKTKLNIRKVHIPLHLPPLLQKNLEKKLKLDHKKMGILASLLLQPKKKKTFLEVEKMKPKKWSVK